MVVLKPLQNKKGQKIWDTREKSSLFPYKRTAFFSGTPNFFDTSYFEAALGGLSKEVSFHLFFHEDFCSDGDKHNYWYNDNLEV